MEAVRSGGTPWALSEFFRTSGVRHPATFHWHVLDKGINHTYIKPPHPGATHRSVEAA